MAQRVAFLVDGFNLYHSARDAQRANGGVCCKWLNLHGLCASYLPRLGPDATLDSLYYFSAPATHLVAKKPDVVNRHRVFIRALESFGVRIELGRFKAKSGDCQHCRKPLDRHEEKESDVAMAVRLVELALTGACETAVLLTGDTDIAPAIRTVQRMAPGVKLAMLFPFKRANAELQQLCPLSFKIRLAAYSRHQLPDPLTLPDGSQLTKPPSW